MNKGWKITALFLVSFLVLHAQTEDGALQKGNDYYRLGQFDMAERHYRDVVTSDATNARAKYNLALALYQQKKYAEARTLLDELSQTAQEAGLKSTSYYNEGVVYTKEKDLEKSIEAYKGALRINPDDKQARENLQKALLELKQKQQQQKQNEQERNKSKSRMSPKEAERQLKRLQEKERQLQERLQSRGQKGNAMPKDW